MHEGIGNTFVVVEAGHCVHTRTIGAMAASRHQGPAELDEALVFVASCLCERISQRGVPVVERTRKVLEKK